jgi:hypothetical protein
VRRITSDASHYREQILSLWRISEANDSITAPRAQPGRSRVGSRIVTFADDLVILCRRGKAEVAFATTAQDHRQAEAHDQQGEDRSSSTG